MNIYSEYSLIVCFGYELIRITYTHRHHQQWHHIEQHKVNHVEQLGVEHLTIQHTNLLLLPILGVNVLNGLAEDKFGR